MVAYPTAIAQRNLFAKALGQGAPGYSAVVRINKEVEIKDEHVNSLPAPANSPPKKYPQSSAPCQAALCTAFQIAHRRCHCRRNAGWGCQQHNGELGLSALGELANMITGNAATRLAQQGFPCNIGPPVMIERAGSRLSALSNIGELNRGDGSFNGPYQPQRSRLQGLTLDTGEQLRWS